MPCARPPVPPEAQIVAVGQSVPQIAIDQLDGFYRTIAVLTLLTTTAACAQLESDRIAAGFSNVSSTYFPASDGWTLIQRKITSTVGQDGKSSDEWQTNACCEEGGVTLVVKVFETPDLDAMIYPLGGDAQRILLEIIEDTPRIVASRAGAERSADGVAVSAAFPTTFWDGGGVLLALEGAGRVGTAGELGVNVEVGLGVGLGFSVGPLRFAWMGGVGYDTWTDAPEIADSTLAYHGPAARLHLGDRLAIEVDVRWRARTGENMRRASAGLVYTGWSRKLGVTLEHTTVGDDPMLDIVGVGLRVGFGGALTRAR